jgi:hypothetical protein
MLIPLSGDSCGADYAGIIGNDSAQKRFWLEKPVFSV